MLNPALGKLAGYYFWGPRHVLLRQRRFFSYPLTSLNLDNILPSRPECPKPFDRISPEHRHLKVFRRFDDLGTLPFRLPYQPTILVAHTSTSKRANQVPYHPDGSDPSNPWIAIYLHYRRYVVAPSRKSLPYLTSKQINPFHYSSPLPTRPTPTITHPSHNNQAKKKPRKNPLLHQQISQKYLTFPHYYPSEIEGAPFTNSYTLL